MTMASNPVLPGFHPDPSICRVGDRFFVVASSFEYFPGLPVYGSTDLVHWELVGNAIHREDQLDLSGVSASGGLFAPTIRHHGGRFLVACTIVGGTGRSGSFVVTATDPAGPWSDPVWIDDADGIDPSILIDRDGRAWWSGTRLAEPGDWPEQTEVWVRELDLATLQLVGEERVVWHGALEGAVWAEGPHLYESDGGIVLLASEGGTERHHAVSAARADAPLGDFRGNPGNPVLTHRHLGRSAAVANVGHADLVDDGRGGWWATVLAVRRIDGSDSLQARETWLVPVDWEDGWPVFAPGLGRLTETVEVPWATEAGAPASTTPAATSVRSALGADGALDPGLLRVRTAPGSDRILGEGSDVRLTPASRRLDEPVPHAFIGFRLEQPVARASIVLSTADAPQPGSRAGLALRLSERRHLSLGVRRQPAEPTARVVDLVLHVDGEDRMLAEAIVPPGPLELVVAVDGFSAVAQAGPAGAVEPIGTADLRPLSPSEGGGFVGVVAGAFAVGEPGDPVAAVVVSALRVEHEVAQAPTAG